MLQYKVIDKTARINRLTHSFMRGSHSFIVQRIEGIRLSTLMVCSPTLPVAGIAPPCYGT